MNDTTTRAARATGAVREAPSAAGVGETWREALPQSVLIPSLLLLFLSCAPASPLSELATLLWLGSMIPLTLGNAGAAVAVQVAAFALYSSQHYEGVGSPFQRPDNYAFLILTGVLFVHRVLPRIERLVNWRTLAVGALLVYGIGQGLALGVLRPGSFNWFMRMFGLPMVAFLLIEQAGLTRRETRSLLVGLLLVGTYMAVVSLIEQIGWHELLFPRWLADAEASRALGSGRSGGLLLQYEWNGLALSLCFFAGFLVSRLSEPIERIPVGLAAALMAVAMYFTYTRATWLAVAVGLGALAFRATGSSSATWMRRFALGTAGLMLVAAMAFGSAGKAGERFGNVDTINYRLNLWATAVTAAAERPLLGYGFSEFGEVADQHERSFGDLAAHNFSENTVAHNTFISTLVELGLIGLLLYGAALFLIVRRTYRAARHRWGPYGAYWLLVFVGVYLIQIQFIVAYEPTTNLMLYGTLGVIASLHPGGRRAAS